MRRRGFLLAAAALLAARAHAQAKPRRIGVLAVGVSSSDQVQMATLQFKAMLARAGLEEGRSVEYEWRFAEGDASRLPGLAEELVRLKVELIVASFNQSILAAKGATRSIPIVMLNAIAPVELGFVQSLARPGGNITGTAWSTPDMMGKFMETLREAAPQAKRIAVLANPGFPGEEHYRKAALAAAAKFGMTLAYFDAARPEDIGPTLKRIAAAKPQALYAAIDTALLAGMREIGDFALKRKLPAMSTVPMFAEMGGLVYYGPDVNELAERTMSYVVRILGGAKPAELPVELPSRFRLIVSKRTATAIGHRLPQSLILRADQVIE